MKQKQTALRPVEEKEASHSTMLICKHKLRPNGNPSRRAMGSAFSGYKNATMWGIILVGVNLTNVPVYLRISLV